MSLTSNFIELSTTPLTFNSSIIIFLRRRLINYIFLVASCFRTSSSLHGPSQHFTLGFPFCSFRLFWSYWLILVFRWCRILLSLLGLFWSHFRFISIIVLLISFIFDLSLFFHIKGFSLLDKYFQAYFRVLLQSFLYKLSLTSFALNSIILPIVFRSIFLRLVFWWL
jgi:hypothetical protein